MAVYAVSDLHGQWNTFEKGLKEIGFTEDDRLYLIGDAIDRGEDGIRILQYIKDHENMDLIIGNHELLMLTAVHPDGKAECKGINSHLWREINGGDITYEKYEELTFPERKSLLDWLNTRYVMKTIKVGETKFCLTHSYYYEGLENKKYNEMKYEEVWNVVWNSPYRDDWDTYRPDIYMNYDYMFITGHIPVIRVLLNITNDLEKSNFLKAFRNDNFYDIDGGCALGHRDGINNGALFLRLDDLKVFGVPLV